ncbi:hypothetical protein SeLEV6574_g00444 [Synchytrium endobioticum]|uniref:Uncharacterized protein n=1 Tax=Synchytrium endobioticum TaxID=286115 RepID=A0A507DJX8_9FUNG|nr:hypothetical protein SeLEV6574_g00444 [Synchytrium endobioticum]
MPPVYQTVIASVVASTISRISTHPLDTLRTLAQLDNPCTPTPINDESFETLDDTLGDTAQPSRAYSLREQWTRIAATYTHIMRRDGINGLYRGVAIALLGQIPGTFVYMNTYMLSKQVLGAWFRSSDLAAVHLASGAIAEVIGGVFFTPMEVVKSRMQATAAASSYHTVQSEGDAVPPDPAPRFVWAHTVAVISHTVKTEGVCGLYRGYWLSLLVFIPYSGLFFVIYEFLKQLTDNATRYWWYLILCGLVASCVGAVMEPGSS